MRETTSARKRIKYELFLLVILALALAVVCLWRAGQKPPEEPVIEATPTAVPTPSPIPEDMYEWSEGKWVHVERGEGNSTRIDDSEYVDKHTKNNLDLVKWCEWAWENQWGYVWGTYGEMCSEEELQFKLEQYPEGVGDYEEFIRENWLGRRTVDCIGLIKGYGWYDADQRAVIYGIGDMADCTTGGMYDAATVKGPIETIPDRPGIITYAEGHVGVYIGDGWVIEAIATTGGVVKTRLADRGWIAWMECPYIEYIDQT